MTKAGEGNLPPKRPSLKGYQKEIDAICSKTLQALEEYEASSDVRQREHLRQVMDEQIDLIRDVSKEIQRHGVHDQVIKVESGYRKYLKESGNESFAALEHDLITLKDYMNLSI